ncbi:uncharacterized protein LAESUDRAFT_626641, partial [Laetiporus sulphureus 93-53]
ITINPDDLHDPVAQLFVGEDINMDHFACTAGPGKDQRACNIASDGFAAARFFHYTIQTIIETLFGVEVLPFGRIKQKIGIFGFMNTYFGTVE